MSTPFVRAASWYPHSRGSFEAESLAWDDAKILVMGMGPWDTSRAGSSGSGVSTRPLPGSQGACPHCVCTLGILGPWGFGPMWRVQMPKFL